MRRRIVSISLQLPCYADRGEVWPGNWLELGPGKLRPDWLFEPGIAEKVNRQFGRAIPLISRQKDPIEACCASLEPGEPLSSFVSVRVDGFDFGRKLGVW